MDCEVQNNTRCKDRAAEQSRKENENEQWASMCVKGTKMSLEVYLKRQKK